MRLLMSWCAVIAFAAPRLGAVDVSGEDESFDAQRKAPEIPGLAIGFSDGPSPESMAEQLAKTGTWIGTYKITTWLLPISDQKDVHDKDHISKLMYVNGLRPPAIEKASGKIVIADIAIVRHVFVTTHPYDVPVSGLEQVTANELSGIEDVKKIRAVSGIGPRLQAFETIAASSLHPSISLLLEAANLIQSNTPSAFRLGFVKGLLVLINGNATPEYVRSFLYGTLNKHFSGGADFEKLIVPILLKEFRVHWDSIRLHPGSHPEDEDGFVNSLEALCEEKKSIVKDLRGDAPFINQVISYKTALSQQPPESNPQIEDLNNRLNEILDLLQGK